MRTHAARAAAGRGKEKSAEMEAVPLEPMPVSATVAKRYVALQSEFERLAEYSLLEVTEEKIAEWDPLSEKCTTDGGRRAHPLQTTVITLKSSRRDVLLQCSDRNSSQSCIFTELRFWREISKTGRDRNTARIYA